MFISVSIKAAIHDQSILRAHQKSVIDVLAQLNQEDHHGYCQKV